MNDVTDNKTVTFENEYSEKFNLEITDNFKGTLTGSELEKPLEVEVEMSLKYDKNVVLSAKEEGAIFSKIMSNFLLSR